MNFETALGSGSTVTGGTLLVAPHQFPHLEREVALAEEFGLELVAAEDKTAFRAGMSEAALVLVTPYARVEPEDFAAMKRCLAVVRYGIGYDNIDVAAAATAGIPVSIVPDGSTEEVASHALALGLSLVRRVPAGSAAIAGGAWVGKIAYDAPRFTDLDVGIIGLGRIGRQVADWYSALGATVKVHDPFIESDRSYAVVPLEDALVTSDVVSLHVPLSDQTRNMISADVLQRMRPGAVLVNVSRGGLVDEEALAAALTAGQIAGAALDTFATEPVSADNPLRQAPNAILTPHMAWRSNRAVEAVQQGVIDRCRLVLTGQPLIDRVA
ncbi:C-terminal binding protein [Modestobacter sp. Leaf380]|uniref:C-terminal binding protein n=1 Tax=Modestobacter sp. Leaf380 TaxID=1736356 RepID=UPI0006F77BDF|nr:C-terminal binding protein [Modestobacter sp. Leaf380]KQS65706.1 hydroxyacid dehydrogenase [Modestobacter sp. Leaf380]